MLPILTAALHWPTSVSAALLWPASVSAARRYNCSSTKSRNTSVSCIAKRLGERILVIHLYGRIISGHEPRPENKMSGNRLVMNYSNQQTGQDITFKVKMGSNRLPKVSKNRWTVSAICRNVWFKKQHPELIEENMNYIYRPIMILFDSLRCEL